MAAIAPEHLDMLRGQRIGPWVSTPSLAWARWWPRKMPDSFYPKAAEVWHRGTGRYQTYVFGPDGTEKGNFFPTLGLAQSFCDGRLDALFPFHSLLCRTVWDRLDDDVLVYVP